MAILVLEIYLYSMNNTQIMCAIVLSNMTSVILFTHSQSWLN
jgi:hypothetical protein